MVDKNRVLVITLSPLHGLNSSMLRTLSMIKGLIELGYTVDMLTIRSSSTTVLNQAEYSFMDNVNVIYADSNKTYDAVVNNSSSGVKQKLVGVLRRLYHKFSVFSYVSSIAKKVKASELPSNEYKYVISVSDPKESHLATISLIKQGLKYEKLIEYWGDPLLGDTTLESIYPQFVYKYIEKKLFNKADRIVYTSPFTLQSESKAFPSLSDKMIYTPTAYIEEKRYSKIDHKYTIGYYGAYPSHVRSIVPLYDACKSMSDVVDLKILGNTDIVLDETDNIEIKPRGDISEYERITDLFICILNCSGTQIPGKLYHYAAYNKPVLVIEDGELAEEMHKFILSLNRYYTCKNEQSDIRRAITDIMADDIEWAPSDIMKSEVVVRTILDM